MSKSDSKKKSGFKGVVGAGLFAAIIYGLWSCGGLGFLGLGNGVGEGGNGSGLSNWLNDTKEKIEQKGEEIVDKADEKIKELTGTATPAPTQAVDTPAPTATPVPTNTPKPTNTPVPVKEEYQLVIVGSDIVFDGIKVEDISSLEQKLTDLYNQGKQLPVIVDSDLASKKVRNDIIECLDALQEIHIVTYKEK